MTDQPLIRTEKLQKYFDVRPSGLRHFCIHAVEDVDLAIFRGETLGLVGESGCGKTTLARTILRLYEPTGGRLFYDSAEITHAEMLPYRRKMQMIFQNPAASLDPRMTAGDTIGEVLEIHRLFCGEKQKNERIQQLLEKVGLDKSHASCYPHELSGGQQQRIGIARALAAEPEFIVCDEAVSSLDASIQSQIINMLEDRKQEDGLTYLFIAHDLSVVKHISDRIGVMYLGRLMELATRFELFAAPLHPYTQALLSAVPAADPAGSRIKKARLWTGDVPGGFDPPSGCRFHTRCPHATQRCREEVPLWKEQAAGHFTACHLF